MSKKIKISCKEASFLISKKQETKLGFYEKMQLHFHLLICDVCKLFKQQLDYITALLKNNNTKNEQHLSEAAKEKMRTKIDDLMQ